MTADAINALIASALSPLAQQITTLTAENERLRQYELQGQQSPALPNYPSDESMSSSLRRLPALGSAPNGSNPIASYLNGQTTGALSGLDGSTPYAPVSRLPDNFGAQQGHGHGPGPLSSLPRGASLPTQATTSSVNRDRLQSSARVNTQLANAYDEGLRQRAGSTTSTHRSRTTAARQLSSNSRLMFANPTLQRVPIPPTAPLNIKIWALVIPNQVIQYPSRFKTQLTSNLPFSSKGDLSTTLANEDVPISLWLENNLYLGPLIERLVLLRHDFAFELSPKTKVAEFMKLLEEQVSQRFRTPLPEASFGTYIPTLSVVGPGRQGKTVLVKGDDDLNQVTP